MILNFLKNNILKHIIFKYYVFKTNLSIFNKKNLKKNYLNLVISGYFLMDVGKIQKMLNDFAKKRDWEKFHNLRNLGNIN